MRTETATLPFVKGDILVERYRVDRLIGRGGMGVVVAAEDVRSGGWVALKLLLPDAARNPEAVERFVREAKACSRIESEHIARVSDVGTLPDGLPYIAMELLEGSDLGEVLTKRQVLPITEAVDYVIEALEPIAEAHSLGIIHRDLKPSNLFVADRADGGTIVKVLDFGISKATDGGLDGKEGALTATSSMIGSPAYMSPEQIKSSKKVDARSDVWSIGVILYESLAGRLPFIGDTVGEVLAEVIEGHLLPIREFRPDIPGDLDAVVCRALARRREDRFPSVAALAGALGPFSSPRVLLVLARIAALEGKLGATGSTPSLEISQGGRRSLPSIHEYGRGAGDGARREAPRDPESVLAAQPSSSRLIPRPSGHVPVGQEFRLGDGESSQRAKPSIVQTAPGWGSPNGAASGIPGGLTPTKMALLSAVTVFVVGLGGIAAVVHFIGPNAKTSAVASPARAAESASPAESVTGGGKSSPSGLSSGGPAPTGDSSSAPLAIGEGPLRPITPTAGSSAAAPVPDAGLRPAASVGAAKVRPKPASSSGSTEFQPRFGDLPAAPKN